MPNEDEIPTLGEASCLTLGLVPNKSNRSRAKELIHKTNLCEVSYKRNSDPFEPFIVSKRLKKINPFLYKSYDDTPPSSPKPNGRRLK